MTTEQDGILQELEITIGRETDGKECYLEASKESRIEAGKRLLQSLTEEEDSHQLKFEEIYNSLLEIKDNLPIRGINMIKFSYRSLIGMKLKDYYRVM